MHVEIRDYQPSDLEAVYRICLRTGAAGQDATALYADPRLLGDFYAAPYLHHDPELALIATCEGEPSGYILGTADSAGFAAWTEENWFPAVRARHRPPDPTDTGAQAALVRRVHEGYRPHPDLLAYPAHLHIDLLPNLQGRGVGRELMQRFLARLRGRGCPAVHLGVGAANPGAMRFYEKCGFHVVGSYPGWRAYGLHLATRPGAEPVPAPATAPGA